MNSGLKTFDLVIFKTALQSQIGSILSVFEEEGVFLEESMDSEKSSLSSKLLDHWNRGVAVKDFVMFTSFRCLYAKFIIEATNVSNDGAKTRVTPKITGIIIRSKPGLPKDIDCGQVRERLKSVLDIPVSG